MKKQEIADKTYENLMQLYPSGECALHWEQQPWKLLCMGMLSAQCTDKKVNEVSEKLFSLFPTPEAISHADLTQLETILAPCGLYHTKAKNIKEICKKLTEEYAGIVPDTMEALLTFPGVGRKVANLVLGDVYKKGGVVADTHCIRISARLGLTEKDNRNPLVTETEVGRLLAGKDISAFCHRIVFFGREYCSARNPKCNDCPMQSFCKSKGKN